MNRREFLRHLTRLAGANALTAFPAVNFANAATSDTTLVTIFMRGGWDGLSVTVPYGDDEYYRLRPTIAVAPPGSSAGALDLDGYFGLHPAMSEIYQMYLNGNVAIMPAVHHGTETLSHFSAQDIIETARADGGQTGWLARTLDESGISAANHSMSLAARTPLSLAGAADPVPNFVHLGNMKLAVERDDRLVLRNVYSSAYGGAPRSNNPNAAALHYLGQHLNDDISALHGVYGDSVATRSHYASGLFGMQLNNAASLLKARPDLRVLALNMGGWDTHNNQGSDSASGKMWNLMRDLSSSVDAFFSELGAQSSNVMVLLVTEFGRTAAENGSGGTDHGHASTWMAIGPRVHGGVYTGLQGWPGLSNANLHNGRALDHTIDFRSIYAEVSANFLGITAPEDILGGYVSNSIGFV